MSRALFNVPECYADGSLGHSYCRGVLAGLLRRVGDCLDHKHSKIVALEEELCEEPSDDFSEESDAIEILNTFAKDGLAFEFVDGDLLLSEVEE